MKPLVSAYPRLYEQLLKSLEEENIHSFDIEAYATEKDGQAEIEIRFGDNFQHVIKEKFSLNNLTEKNQDYLAFCTKTGETCKETLIQDYFKMVKP
ncbi:hypothetical protein SAMN04487944_107109 [Gracilibacillus ureilyticus]|uniref:Uncharacterized protein n=1 Tax=Gracilibacillus ureilyticus TaxID=531814 RepID=A0A1H9QUJ4_9BACI|nr:hypothetical protein [Gracilibacillus ureilyticus]SER64134.1 hypothetical protein SAMN04487944_107109 [Gracilibacillus ureilyticus]